jgi:hypothetical protein
MSLYVMSGLIALLVSLAAVGLSLLRKSVVLAPAAKPAPQAPPEPQPVQPLQPVLTVRQDDPVVAELAGLLRRHLDMLPQNYDVIPAWERLVEDTVRTLLRHQLAPVAKLAAEQQAATVH